MSVQDILRILGVVLLVAAAVLAVVAGRTYRALDIRGVKDDLAGRQKGARSANGPGPRADRREGEKTGVASAKAAGTSDGSKAAGASDGSERPNPLPVARSNDAAGRLRFARPRPDEETDALTAPDMAHGPAPLGCPAAPAIRFRVTRKEIVVASEKTIEE